MIITALLTASILQYFNISQDRYLGEGGESLVYKLNDEKILRIQKKLGKKQYEMVQTQKSLYDALKIEPEIFSIPHIDNVEMKGDVCYSIEQLIQGENLTVYLKKEPDKNLYSIMKSYIEAAAHLHTIRHELGNFFGEVLAENNLHEKFWPEFLLNRIDQALEKTHKYLQKDVHGFDALLANWKSRVQQLQVTKNHLVHGDFFPSNVLVDTNGQIKAVIDFSPLTILGDWRMDIVGAYIFLEVTDSYREEQSVIAAQIIADKFGDSINQDIIDLYRMYYSLYFSVVKDEDEKLYQWCIDNLNNKLHL